jgi:hypothetical protein
MIGLIAVASAFSYQSFSNNISDPLSTPYPLNDIQSQHKFNVDSARKYVMEMYNDSLGLVRENAVSERYWLLSDNFLASLVLVKSYPAISKNITDTLQYYKNQFSIKYFSPWAVIDNEDRGEISFNASSDRQLTSKIWYTAYDGSNVLRCEDYADIAFLKSIYLYENNQFSEAKRCYDLGENMFDGKGFKDHESGGSSRYTTYKLALWKIADKMTPFGTKDSSVADAILIAMQDCSSGGVHTHYNADLFPDSETNVETTSVSLMAFDLQYIG